MSIEARLMKLEQKQDSTGTPFEFVNDDGTLEVVMMYGTHEQWLDSLEQHNQDSRDKDKCGGNLNILN
jgi:hypothetical protein